LRVHLNATYFEPDERRWGTYSVALPLPLTTDSEAEEYLRALLPVVPYEDEQLSAGVDFERIAEGIRLWAGEPWFPGTGWKSLG
jgi:hypothetical protein